MGLGVAQFQSSDGDGVVFYDTTTMYVYPVKFASLKQADQFNQWLIDTTGKPMNGQDDNHFVLWERYYELQLQSQLRRASMHVPRVICGCNTAMTILRNSVVFEMLLKDGKPYYKISTDIHECKSCGNTVALPAAAPIAEAFEGAKYESVIHARTGKFVN